MGLLDLPDGWTSPTRDELIDRYKRDVALLNPEADVTTGQVDMDARLMADIAAPLYSDAALIAEGINEDEATGERLDRAGDRIGLKRGQATGASGYVAVEAAAGGAFVLTGTELQNKQTKLRYEFAETKRVSDGDHVRVRARDTGPNTDVPPGTVLAVTNPPPGLGQLVTVVEQSDGRGLTGGAEKQGDPRYLETIRDRKQNPIGGDNDAEIADVLRRTPDVPVEQVFTYPGAYAGGSTAFTFSVLAPKLGASRLPTDAQLQAAWEWLNAQMPGHSSYFPITPVRQDLVLAFAVTWATGGWQDATPWPAAYANGVVISAAAGPLNFTVSGGSVAPVAGNTLAVWDTAVYTLRRKTVLSVTGSGPWTIVCDTANGASDTTYTPAVGQRVSPWADNLLAVPAPVLSYLATIGPGELFDTSGALAEGRRRKRFPPAPKFWPFTTSSKVTTDLAALPQVGDATAKTGIGVTVAPALPMKFLELSDLALYPV